MGCVPPSCQVWRIFRFLPVRKWQLHVKWATDRDASLPPGQRALISSPPVLSSPFHRNVDGYKETLRSLRTPPVGDLEPACTPNPMHPETGVQPCLFSLHPQTASRMSNNVPHPRLQTGSSTHTGVHRGSYTGEICEGPSWEGRGQGEVPLRKTGPRPSLLNGVCLTSPHTARLQRKLHSHGQG